MITKADLLAEPMKCASIYAMEIVQVHGFDSRLKPKVVMDAHPSVQSYAQVGGESRVMTAKLETVKRTCTVSVGPYDPQADDDLRFPIYYLPWRQNSVVRTSLKPSQRVTLAAQPRLFFTANLNGCMVSVEGPPEEPTVYHSNVIGYKGSPGLDPQVPEDKAKRRIGKKVGAMMSGYYALSAQHPRGKKTYVQPGHITQFRYQALLGRPSAQVDEERARRLLEEQDAELADKLVGTVVTSTGTLGTVFGVRHIAGKWAFYFQRLLLVRYSRVDGVYNNGMPRLSHLYEDWSTLRCEKFWPGGPGTMRF